MIRIMYTFWYTIEYFLYLQKNKRYGCCQQSGIQGESKEIL